MLRPSPSRLLIFLGLPLWLAVIGAGSYCIVQYETTPAISDAPALTWPNNTSLIPQPDRANLVLAVHPRCPCTRATLDELAELVANVPKRIAVHVLVYRPRVYEGDWERTEIWRNAAAIVGVEVKVDEDGVQAERFGAISSGHALLYDADCQLIFSGGLTDARGHAGDSVGRSAILALLDHSIPSRTRTPVYGCSLAGAKTNSSERCVRCQE